MRRLPLIASIYAATIALAPAARADFDSCLAGLRSAAAAQGVSNATFDRVMAGVTPDPKVIESMNSQPEFKTPIWDYLATLVDEQKVAEGRQMMSRHAQALASAEQRFGVDRYTIAAVWGVESDYGNIAGRWSLPQSLSTLACTSNRRQAYFR
ncbi:MAG: lytic transglycosylase, partial [Hyphomicrobiales bacterium]|nr:lytic transglycosylase [Hyphomicrobiales bacterium]